MTPTHQLVTTLQAITTILVNAECTERVVDSYTWNQIAQQLLEASTFARVHGGITPDDLYETRSPDG